MIEKLDLSTRERRRAEAVVPRAELLSSRPVVDLPSFAPRAPWLSADLQTMRNFVVRRFGGVPSNLPGERLYLDMKDGSGDRLAATLNQNAPEAPLVVLLHGITGCETSSHMIITSRYLNRLGYRVLRLNLRGAGPSRETCRDHYHGGSVGDLADALAALDPALTQNGLLLAGYSLGGAILLKFLSEFRDEFPIRAAAAVSAPIDLAQASRRVTRLRNRIYDRWLLRRMKEEVAGAEISDDERQAIASARSVYAFDDRFVAPHHGFGSAEHYYVECSALHGLHRIAVPTLVLHARDDPWIPPDAYLDVEWSANPNLTAVLTRHGGHLGYHGRGSLIPWHVRCIECFFSTICRQAYGQLPAPHR